MPVSNDDAVVVIPARYGSTRMPAKPLADIAGDPMVVHVARQAARARLPQAVIVATDDARIRDAVGDMAEVRMTRADHESGSDRVAEVAAGLPHGIVVNVQGDLPLLDPAVVDELIERLRADPELGIATAAVPVSDTDELADPGAVKVVCDLRGRALYFSRAAIPHDRDAPGSIGRALHHVGVYAYRRETLLSFAALEPTPLERTEKLEQLRAMENGILIGIVIRDAAPPMEVDTPADLEAVRRVVADPERSHAPGGVRRKT